MFDIGGSEIAVIAVVALIAIGPKELPGVLRTVGQWVGKARKMAAEFQGQFNEAMREAEMADLKKTFDDVKQAASGFSGSNIMTSLQQDVSNSLRVDDIDKPAAQADETPAIPSSETVTGPESNAAVFDHAAGLDQDQPASKVASEPLVITPDVSPQPAPDDSTRDAVIKDAKAS